MGIEDIGVNPHIEKIKSTESGDKQLSLLSLSREQHSLSKNAALLNSDEAGSGNSLKNIAAVYTQLLPEIPSAIGRQLKQDIQNDTGSTALHFAESAAIGFGAAVLLAKSPVLAKTLLTGAGLGSTALMLGSSALYTKDAMGANTSLERQKLVESGLHSTAKLGAGLIESTPAMLLGASGGYMLSSRVAALDSIAVSTRNVAEYKIRSVVPEGFHYIGLDAKNISSLGTNAELNILKAGEEMMARTPWRGVEEGRFFKVAAEDSLRISERLPGSQYEVVMGRRGQQMFHTHESEILPTSGDFTSVYGTGVIGVPKQGILTFYEGVGKEAQAAVSLIKAADTEKAVEALQALQDKAYPALVVEPSKQLAMRVDLRWNPLENRMSPNGITPLDYADTVKNLSKWNGRFTPSAIQSSPEAMLRPGMSDLIRKINLDAIK